MPDVTLMGKIWVIQETIAWLSVADHPPCKVPEGVILQFSVRPHIGPTVYLGILP